MAGGPSIVNAQDRSADPGAIAAFVDWHDRGLLHWATTVPTHDSGRPGVVTHAGVTYGFWVDDLDGDRDPQRVADRINAMPLDQVARPGEMYGNPGAAAPGPVWASTEEMWKHWKVCPWLQVHGHSSAHSAQTGWRPWAPTSLRRLASIDGSNVWFTPSNRSAPIIGVDPGLWETSPVGSLQPLVFES